METGIFRCHIILMAEALGFAVSSKTFWWRWLFSRLPCICDFLRFSPNLQNFAVLRSDEMSSIDICFGRGRKRANGDALRSQKASYAGFRRWRVCSSTTGHSCDAQRGFAERRFTCRKSDRLPLSGRFLIADSPQLLSRWLPRMQCARTGLCQCRAML